MGNSIKLNLGSGKKLLDDFINVDSAFDFKDKNFVKADVRKLPFPDNYADYILARQVLEHIPFLEIMDTLEEWLRVLKPGGRMVVTAPNFDEMAQEWVESKFKISEYYEMANGIYGNQAHDKEFHVSPITPNFLKHCMVQLWQAKYKILVYPQWHKVVEYPGYHESADRGYRFGEVHLDVKKQGKYAQYNEEEMEDEIFDKIGTKNKFFVEIGSHEKGIISNTHMLKERGWVGHWIDQAPGIGIIKERVNAENINEILKKYNVPKDFDLFSIDIDGMDYWVWKAMTWKPRVVIIEYNPNKHKGVQPYDPDFRWDTDRDELTYGATKDELVKLGKKKGYELYHTNEDNLFFIKNENSTVQKV